VNYPAQPWSEVLDQLIVGGVIQFSNNINGVQEFTVVADNGDGYAGLRFRSTSTANGLPTLNLFANADQFELSQGTATFYFDRTRFVATVGSYSIGVNESGYVVNDPVAFRAASQSIGALELNAALVALVSANTGRNPINGEAITYDLTNNRLIWGAPVYDNSLDFSAPFNSMYIPLLFRKF
jgi:hypothetical protein